ncbi:MAG: NADH-quinone oxidoreductase subunit N [Phycisphaeraceae bacterium]|nr:NADH-quinone oxidoreductase subunit N [Phycisphaeraceae bacterium]
MVEKLAHLWPEIVLFVATCIVMVLGLSPKREVRRLCSPVCGLALVVAMMLAINLPGIGATPLPTLMPFAKAVIAGVGLLILLLLAGTVDREDEDAIAAGSRVFDPLRANRAEFYAFFLFSLTGAMLCASADDLIWLFLALELTSLPTYVMVVMSTRGTRSQEAGVKYFFLGAMGAAIFLYGFALLYGGTGSTNLRAIATALATQGATDGINPIALTGLVLSIIGVSFKIAAVPMHFYTADVYQGASSPVSAMLAFVPKTAGFISILLLVSLAGWSYGVVDGREIFGEGFDLPAPIRTALWIVAALTMTVGNVLAVVQTSVKRILAYSSIAHSGYMLVGVIAGPPRTIGAGFTENGVAAVLFYLLAYGVMNVGAFAAIAALDKKDAQGRTVDADEIDDIRGLCRSRPVLGWTMVICALSLLGLPPLLGFFGKFGLFAVGIYSGELPLVIIMGLNSAIAAFYYLRLAALPLLEEPRGTPPLITPFTARIVAGVLSAAGSIGLVAMAGPLMGASVRAAKSWQAMPHRDLSELDEPAESPPPPVQEE